MSAGFDLIITADDPSRTAKLCLLDTAGIQLAFRETDFKPITVSRQQGLFNLRDLVLHYVDQGNEEASIAEIGVCIAEEVLGKEIFLKLWESTSQRTLRIQLPGATDQENLLAAALARVPWEMARPAVGKPTLAERHLLVRVVHDMAAPASQPLALESDEPLRVLFIFADARGSPPLAARRERGELLQLFQKEIYPKRRIVAHFLSHGVTRERLAAQIRENGGYHVIHWSGHGHLNLLELATAQGERDLLSGQALLDLCGGFIPRLVFLSACHSGDILRVTDWKDFLAVAQGKEPETKRVADPATKDIPLDVQPGYTGTAHALLQGGVPSVIAMRYAVGDDYARELGVEFYRALMAYSQPMPVAAALTAAREAVRDPRQHDIARFAACDHATPVLYGAEEPGLTLPNGPSPGLFSRNPRLHRIPELTTAGHEHFVGRTWELAGLGAEFIGSREGAEVKPVAVVIGLGGMGKTALTAEALALWENRFEWVLLYQAKPNALGFDRDFLWNMHIRLTDKSDAYRARIAANSRDAIWLPAEGDFTGSRRVEQMLENLVAVLRDHAILLVFDNFETNLEPQPMAGTAAGPLWACQDPVWDRCLALLATEMVGTPSRALITSRRPLAALAGTACHSVRLGPLSAGEGALYVQQHTDLSKMVFGGDPGKAALAFRLLDASRFHPLLMDRLTRLATGDTSLQTKLTQALDALEETKDLSQLPTLFTTSPGDPKELAYLDDALATSLDQLIGTASPDARRLLWTIAVANEPVTLDLLKDVWSGKSFDLQQLLAVGLATEVRAAPDDANPELTCHELVRNRILTWMRDHEADRPGLTGNAIRLAYAERLEAAFKALLHKDMTAALQAGSRALIYCVQAGAYDGLGNFASWVVTSARDPRLLEGLLPHLEAAARSAPEGPPRWQCLRVVADALRLSGRPDQSLVLYEQAAAQARIAAEAGFGYAHLAWFDLGVIKGNWAIALHRIGDLDTSRNKHLEAGEAHRNAKSPAIYVKRCELEAYRIDIRKGSAAEVLPQVEKLLSEVEDWWQRHRAGQFVADAPDPEFLARGIISSLDVAGEAHMALEDWKSSLRCADEELKVKRELQRPPEDIAETRMSRASVLGEIGRYGEAKEELETCLSVYQNDPTRRARSLSSLANLLYKQGDVPQAITQQHRSLGIREQLPDPRDRASSHGNLATYLRASGTSTALAEYPRHQLAALVYQLVSGLGQHIQTSLRNYAADFRDAQAAGTSLAVPRLAELLADTAFRPLDDWLRKRQANVAEVQATVDRFLEQARKMAMEDK